MAKNPFGNVPTFTIPPPPAKKSKSKGTPLDQFIRKYPDLKPYANQIAQWSATYHASPITVAAVIQFESSGRNDPYNPKVQGAGIAQINPGKSPNLTQFENLYGKLDPMNTSQAIQYLAWNVAAAGNPDAQTFYTTVWNPGFKPSGSRQGPGGLLKGLGLQPVTATGTTAAQGAAAATARAAAKNEQPYNRQELRVKYYTSVVEAFEKKGYPTAQAVKLANQAINKTVYAKIPASQALSYLESQYKIDLSTVQALLTESQLRSQYFTQMVDDAMAKGYSQQQATQLANQAIDRTIAQKPTSGAEIQILKSQYEIALAGTKQVATLSELKSKYYDQLVQKSLAAGYTQADAKQIATQAISQTAKAQISPQNAEQVLTSQYVLDLGTLERNLKLQKQDQSAVLSQFKRTTTDYTPTFLAYAGRAPTALEIQQIINKGSSKYQVAADLMKSAGFYKSPIWQQNAGRYQAYYQKLYGPAVTAPKSVIAYAIQHSLDETSFEGMLTNDQLPGQTPYNKSEEYKGLYATYQSAYSNIYGLPDSTGASMIDQAIKKGWTADQWTNYLRAQPEYTSSGEYKSRAMDLASRLGLIQSTQQTLLGQNPPAPAVPQAVAPAANPSPVQQTLAAAGG